MQGGRVDFGWRSASSAAIEAFSFEALQSAEKLEGARIGKGTTSVVPLSYSKCICASAPEVRFFRVDDFFQQTV
jgi:hypothetical protein